jgi:hypothetical protein
VTLQTLLGAGDPREELRCFHDSFISTEFLTLSHCSGILSTFPSSRL